jgi:hypothetical protein
MAFWSDSNEGMKDPKRQYRWILVNDHIPSWTLKKVGKPSYTVSETSHKYINHTYYYPGRVEWNTISLTLADPVDPDAASTVTEIIRQSGYSPALNAADLDTMSKAKATTALGQIQIQQIDGNGVAVETWTLWNAWIKDVKYGELDYEGDDMTDVEIELRYDWAYLETVAAGTQGEKSFFVPGSSS